jgi:hypothetical protein
MKNTLTLLLVLLIWSESHSQTAPSHLKYFGFAAIDCFYDDPLDASIVTNYISEVDTFSNIAHMCVFDYTDNVVSRVNYMNSLCVSPALYLHELFFQVIDNNAPSGNNYDLYPDYIARWNTFKTTNSSVLIPEKIGCFYIADEPFWNGITYTELEAVTSLVEGSHASIPKLMVEVLMDSLVVPFDMDWVGFDRYGVFDPQIDPAFLQDLDTVKARLSNVNQKVILIIDDQWLPFYGVAGYAPDTMKYVVQNYYDLAASDTSIIGLLGYIWPGGLDDPGQLGVRNLTQGVIDKNVEIGQLIKANYSPCSALSSHELEQDALNLKVFPNPSNSTINVSFSFEPKGINLLIYSILGELMKIVQTTNNQELTIDLSDLSNGLYYIIYDDKINPLNTILIIDK